MAAITYEQFYAVCEWIKKTYPAKEEIIDTAEKIAADFNAHTNGKLDISASTVRRALKMTGRKRTTKKVRNSVDTTNRIYVVCKAIQVILNELEGGDKYPSLEVVKGDMKQALALMMKRHAVPDSNFFSSQHKNHILQGDGEED